MTHFSLHTSLLCALAFTFASLFNTSSAKAEEFTPDNEGFIRHWLLLAPIAVTEDAGAEDIEKQQISDEAKLEPKAGDKVKVDDKEFAWKKIEGKDYYFDINELLGGTHEDVCAYAVCYLVASEEMKGLELNIGSNDQAKIYINGKEVFKFTETRTIEKDSDKVKDITLNKGVNTIVFKIINGKNNWAGALRFKKADAAVTNFKIKLEK